MNNPVFDRYLEFRATLDLPQDRTFCEHGQRELLPPKPKRNRHWPTLKGLRGRDYHREYMRLARARDQGLHG